MSSPTCTAKSFDSDILSAHDAVTDDGFHIDFVLNDGDLTLVSSDGIKFRTHHFILQTASGLYRKTSCLPQTSQVSDEKNVIRLPENSRTLNAILRMISGMPIPPLDNYDDIENVLLTAKKWDMHGPPSIIHRMVMPQSLLHDPVRLYALACKTGWHEAAVIAAKYTLDVDLQHEDVVPLLRTMCSTDVLKLMDLRTRRRDALLEFLLTYTIPGCLAHLPHSGDVKGTDAELGIQWQWKAFMFTVFIAMDRHPSGKTLFGPNSVLRDDLEDLRSTRCPECEDKPAFDVDELVKEIKWQLSELPITIS